MPHQKRNKTFYHLRQDNAKLRKNLKKDTESVNYKHSKKNFTFLR